MAVQPTEGNRNMDLDKVFGILREGLNENTRLGEMRQIVEYMLPVDKYRLMSRFLSRDQGFSMNERLNSLPIFLDENTTFFNFVQGTTCQSSIYSILELIPRYSPNIETIDFGNLWIESENKENFKNILKNSKKLKSLRVRCLSSDDCAINQLLLQEDFDLQDKDVQIGLQKIEYIYAVGLFLSQSTKLLKVLPNLKSIGNYQELGPILSSYIDNDDDLNRFMIITEFADRYTNSTTLEYFVKYCPNTKRITLMWPDRNVIENLSKFPLLTDICIHTEYFDQIMNLIIKIGKQIKKLDLKTYGHYYDPDILHELCPELLLLETNENIYRF